MDFFKYISSSKKNHNNSRNSRNFRTTGHPETLFMELHASPSYFLLLPLPQTKGFPPPNKAKFEIIQPPQFVLKGFTLWFELFTFSLEHTVFKKARWPTVFLTHVSIWQMPTWLPTWKAKSLYHISTFLRTWFFLPLQKFKTIKIPIPKQIRAHCIFQGISKTFLNIYALLFIFRKL